MVTTATLAVATLPPFNGPYAGLSFSQQGGVLAACYVLCVLIVCLWVQMLFRFFSGSKRPSLCSPNSCCLLTMQYAYLKCWSTCCCCCGPRTMRVLQNKVEKIKIDMQNDIERIDKEYAIESDEDEESENEFQVL